MRIAVALALILALAGPVAVAADPTPALAAERAADEVLAALARGDAEGVGRVAERSAPRLWLVVDALCGRGRFDEAAGLARRAHATEAARLAAYVASRRGRAGDGDLRRRVEAAEARNDAKAFLEALALVEAIGGDIDGVLGARIAAERGTAFRGLGRLADAARAYLRSADVGEAAGWGTWTLDALGLAEAAWTAAGDADGARRAIARAVDVARQSQDGLREGDALVGLARLELNARRFEAARATYERAVAVYDTVPSALGVGRARAGSFRAAQGLGDEGEVRRAAERLATAWGAQPTWRRDPWTGVAVAEAALLLGRSAQALDEAERIVTDAQRGRDPAIEALGWDLVARAHRAADRTASSVAATERSIELRLALGERRNAAILLVTVANGYRNLGDYARAFAAIERALALDRALAGAPSSLALISLGLLEKAVGNFEAAGRALTEVLRAADAAGEPLAVADAVANLGTLRYEAGEFAEARGLHARALTIRRAVGTPAGIAASLGSLALVAGDLGDPAAAARGFAEALALQARAGDALGVARTQLNLAWAHEAAGDVAAAEASVRQALAAARALGSAELVRASLHGLAYLCARAGRTDEALRSVREATEVVGALASGLSDDAATRVRGERVRTTDLGVKIAGARGDLDALVYFAECGRGGALLEAIVAREAAARVELPVALREAEAGARTRAAAAVRAAREADGGGDAAAIRARRREADVARDDLREVVERIEREVKRAAATGPVPVASLATVRAGLAVGEAFVWYVLVGDGPVALVATRADARLVRLAPTLELDDACDGLVAEIVRRGPGVAAATARVRDRLLTSLALPAGTRRLVVSPDGPLAHLPFAVLAPDLETVCVPSATAYVRSQRTPPARGEGVLALGDPVYRAARPVPPGVRAARDGRGPLERLPGSATEAEAVGDVVLLRERATERGLFDALATRPRWRSVHLACHGMFDARRPEFSSLALTPDADDDGFLTALEVSRASVPADLVVLSACDTGRGRVVRGEGAQGLTRAFLLAGAPRVVCALWKVDDAATTALMKRFYARFHPADGSQGLSVIAALRDAQAFVAAQPPWQEPAFWAAWVLWGLPD